jgi:hypothetical protein
LAAGPGKYARGSAIGPDLETAFEAREMHANASQTGRQATQLER